MKRYRVRQILCIGLAGISVLGIMLGSIGEVYAGGNPDVRAADIPINETTFPDPVFRQWIMDTYDLNGDNNLSTAETATMERVSDITSFSMSNTGATVKNWKGIEYFTDITAFKLGSTNTQQCQAVTVDLSKNRYLRSIEINAAQSLTTLEIAGLSSLISVECAYTAIYELELNGLNSLQRLVCLNSKIKKLDTSNLSNLQLLVCDNNPIEELSVSGLSNLIALQCSNTSITELDVSGLTKLQGLFFNNTAISEIDLSSLSSLEELRCNNTLITELDLSGLNKLKRLHCNNMPLTGLDVSELAELTDLYCNDSQLAALDLSQNIHLGANLNISSQTISAPLYYDGDSYYVDLTSFSGFDKTCLETIDSPGSSYDYDSSKGWMKSQAALQVGERLYYNYNTGTAEKMQVIVEISKLIDLTPPTTETATEKPVTTTTEMAITTENSTEASTSVTETTEASTTESSQASSTEEATESSVATAGSSEHTADANVQKPDTPRTGDNILLIWISMLGIFAVTCFLVTGGKQSK